MYSVMPQLRREYHRAFSYAVTPGQEPKEQADFSISRHTVEFPFGKAVFADDEKKPVTKAKPGDKLLLFTKTSGKVTNRIVEVEVPAALYEYGSPVFKRLYRHGDKVFAPIAWECRKAYDLSNLPFLCEAYIVNEVIK